jgi:hypothetical protein
VCRACGGPVRRHPREPFIALHDNRTSWYAGRQVDHDAEVAGNRYRVQYQAAPRTPFALAFVMDAAGSDPVWRTWTAWRIERGVDYDTVHVINEGLADV